MIKVTVKGVEMSIGELAELYDELDEFFGSITVKEAGSEEVEEEVVEEEGPEGAETEDKDWP